MSNGGWLKRLFGGGGAESAQPKAAEAIEYKGYRIVPAPRPSGGRWNVAGTISLGANGETRTYSFIRADNDASWDDTVQLTIIKAKRMIDTEGERIFDKPSAF